MVTPKWHRPEQDAVVRITRAAVREQIAAGVARHGGSRAELLRANGGGVLGAVEGDELEREIFARFEAEEGRRYHAGSEIAAVERPQRYALRAAALELIDRSQLAPGAVGDGDNVFVGDDVTGDVVVIREVAEVERLVDEGVPDGAIAVIDDAGGTMSAPILADFDGVLCVAGSVRSHLAIIAREFEVPTLMAVRLAEVLETGDRITVEYSAPAQAVDALFDEDLRPRATVRRAGSDR